MLTLAWAAPERGNQTWRLTLSCQLGPLQTQSSAGAHGQVAARDQSWSLNFSVHPVSGTVPQQRASQGHSGMTRGHTWDLPDPGQKMGTRSWLPQPHQMIPPQSREKTT